MHFHFFFKNVTGNKTEVETKNCVTLILTGQVGSQAEPAPGLSFSFHHMGCFHLLLSNWFLQCISSREVCTFTEGKNRKQKHRALHQLLTWKTRGRNLWLVCHKFKGTQSSLFFLFFLQQSYSGYDGFVVQNDCLCNLISACWHNYQK